MADRHPPPFDCATCGACCREAFDTVPVEDGDEAMRTRRPEWLQVDADGHCSIRRVPSPTGCGTRCAALRGDGGGETPFRCDLYPDRPEACSGLEEGSEACRFARRRVGLPG